ncbi:hypothetical protein ACFU98_33045 [Streptomyces sp. NPDC057575]|uniref:hypothetical protein n=1 Tax=unclassified Streptomyces TaxID=2593676 RepID=UPI0036CF8647
MHAHWGTFTKGAYLGDALIYASNAMTQKGFAIWDPPGDGDYEVIGGNGDVIATVVCVPQSEDLWISVSAYSTDSGLAERTRNDVREYIVRQQRIDDNP